MSKFITRMTNADTYMLRLPVIKDGEIQRDEDVLKQVMFAFKDYDGNRKAKQAAIAYRDKYLKKHKMLYILTLKRRSLNVKHRCSPNNKTGVIGITDASVYHTSGLFQTYRATWSKNRKLYSKSFAVTFWGKKEAFLMACRTRFEHKGTLIITNKKKLVCLPDVPYILEN